jgi:nicotinate-nucleotide pyrophosphorylase (carboxylating)
MTIDQIIEAALHEDIGTGDHTSLSAIPKTASGKSRLIIKEEGILCGVDIAVKVFEKIDPSLKVTKFLNDGTAIKYGDIAFIVEGSSISILTAERLVLNFMQRMSGIATVTHQYVKQLEGTNARLLDTRKTTPLMRVFEKYAVKTGGGENHRFGLFDMIMIKDNHIDFAGGIAQAISAVKTYLAKNKLDLKIEIEARSLKDVQEILTIGGIDRIMLDNFAPGLMKEAVEMIAGRYETEASGGITLENLREYALTGVNYISVGALTHHIKSLDMSLKAISE